jgi:hypothetical protein
MKTMKEPLRCKLFIDGNTIEHVKDMTYLGIELTSYINLDGEVAAEPMKASRIAGCLNEMF